MGQKIPHEELSDEKLLELFQDECLAREAEPRAWLLTTVEAVLGWLPQDRRLQMTWSSAERRWRVAIGAKVYGSSAGCDGDERFGLRRALLLAGVNFAQEKLAASTRWTCEVCGTQGTVRHPWTSAAFQVAQLVLEDHRKCAPNCVGTHGSIQFRPLERTDATE